MTRQRWYSLVIIIIATTCFGVQAAQGSVGRQGHEMQGHKVQGHEVQGHEVQGHEVQGHEVQGHEVHDKPWRGRAEDVRPWLQGERLIGLRGVPKSDELVLEIVGFHGHQILALVSSGTSGGWQAVTLSPWDIVGLTWLEHRCESRLACERVTYRIAAATPDTTENTMPEHADNSDVWLYRVEYALNDSPHPGDWQDACAEGSEASGLGVFVDGRWNADGSWRPGGYTFACTSGVVAKCVRGWGYKPWKQLSDARGREIDLQPLHQACTRAARADYCGDGISHTREGTVIDMFDIHGFNRPESLPGFVREAGFTPEGANWVARKRWLSSSQPDDRTWTVLPTCQRPQSALASADDPVLLEVWSRVRRAPVIRAGRDSSRREFPLPAVTRDQTLDGTYLRVHGHCTQIDTDRTGKNNCR